MDDDRGWRHLATIFSEEKAVLLQGRLETEGIPCSIESLKYHAEPVNFGRLSEVRLWVLDADLERARALLAELGEETAERIDESREEALDRVDPYGK